MLYCEYPPDKCLVADAVVLPRRLMKSQDLVTGVPATLVAKADINSNQ
jgi:hypothetical protein